MIKIILLHIYIYAILIAPVISHIYLRDDKI